MEKVYLDVKVRESKGTGVSKSLRRQGVVPAVLYGRGKNELLSVGNSALIKLLHAHSAESTMITLKIQGGKSEREAYVLIKELQRNPMSGSFLHVDFNEISLTDTIEVNVPLAAKGEPQGVKLEGGTLEHLLWELKIKCLPTNIPANIEVDVSQMKIGDDILIKDVKIPEGIKLMHEAEQIVFSLKPPVLEKPPEEAVEAEASKEPEVLKQKTEEQLAKEAEEKAKKKEEKEKTE